MSSAIVVPISRGKPKVTKAKKPVKKAVKAVTKKVKRKRISRADKFLASKELQAEFRKKYPVCTGKFRKTPGTPPTPSHSVQAQVKVGDELEWVYKQDCFQIGRKKAPKKKAVKKPAGKKRAVKKTAARKK